MDKAAVSKHRLRISDIALVVIALCMTISFVRSSKPAANELMLVSAVDIPDHEYGYDPEILYDRIIHREFSANWFVKIFPVGSDVFECKGDGTYIYEPTDMADGMTLSEYVGAFCDLTPGDYFARTRWVPVHGETIRNTSNVFTVFRS